MSDQQPELVGNWLARSRSDLNLGRAALRARGVLPEDACFHAQQCAAVQTRYPGECEAVSKTEARQALERAAVVLAWVEKQIPTG